MENAITIITLGAVCVAQGGTIVIREIQNRRDRRDLLDRIMSVDYQEYKKCKTPAAQRAGHVRLTDERMAAEERKKGG